MVDKLKLRESSYSLRRVGVVAALSSLSLLAAACGNSKETSETCLSPHAESDVYTGDSSANPDDQETWQNGIKVTTSLPKDAEGLVVSYRPPNAPDWTDTSKPVEPDRASEIALRIGAEDVIFSTQVVAKLGSTACDTPPDSTFSEPLLFDDLLEEGAAIPKF